MKPMIDGDEWPRPHRLTVDEYYRMAAAGLLSPDDRMELIEGEIIDMPPIGSRHAIAVDLLAERLIRALRGSAHLRIQGPIRLSDTSEPQPDLSVLRPPAERYVERHPAAADVLLVIEVSESTLRFDREDKARLYARHGIPLYWIIDLAGARVHVCKRPSGGIYEEVRSLTGSSPVTIDSLSVDVDFAGIL